MLHAAHREVVNDTPLSRVVSVLCVVIEMPLFLKAACILCAFIVSL